MKKLFLFIILLNSAHIVYCQKFDTIISTNIYNSYFNYQFKIPVVVTYKLYKGGGECNRKKFRFINDIKRLKTATDKDYAFSGYDKGHMVNAEDFAFDCTLDQLTFRYYNCVPQKPGMNRGIWKTYETKIREKSQEDSLYIMMINVVKNDIIGKGIGVPNQCIKIVYSLTDGEILYSFEVSNSDNPFFEKITIDEINKKYNFEIERFKKFTVNQ